MFPVNHTVQVETPAVVRILPATLVAASRLGSHLLLECVREAASDKLLFCLLRDFLCTQQVLELSHVWPAKKCRWWCVLSANWLGPLTLPDLPNQASRCVISQVIPCFPQWSRVEQAQIELPAYELKCFS